MIPPRALIRRLRRLLRALAAAAMLAGALRAASPENDARLVAALDTAFQKAVKENDADTIARILAPEMVLVTGRGQVFTRADHIEQARTKAVRYELQDELPGTQTVRLIGENTAIVTALLAIRGRRADGTAIAYQVWFSDTYVRTPSGWRYAFGQSSLPLPKTDERPAS